MTHLSLMLESCLIVNIFHFIGHIKLPDLIAPIRLH